MSKSELDEVLAPHTNEGGKVSFDSVERFVEVLNHFTSQRTAVYTRALRFYADSLHVILSDGFAWDTVSGEPQNFICDEAGTATIETGLIAATALKEGLKLVASEDTLRAQFEEAVYGKYFLSTVQKVNNGPFGLQNVDLKDAKEFLERDAEGHYIADGLEPAWWAWRTANSRRGQFAILPRKSTEAMRQRVHEGPLGAGDHVREKVDDDWIEELYQAFLGPDKVGE